MQDRERQNEEITSNLLSWCERLLSLHFDVSSIYFSPDPVDTNNFQDPVIKERVIQLAIVFATNPLKRNTAFAFKVFEYTLDTRLPDDPSCTAYSDAVKELHNFCIHQLQRLAMRFPDYYIVRVLSFPQSLFVLSHLDRLRSIGEQDQYFICYG